MRKPDLPFHCFVYFRQVCDKRCACGRAFLPYSQGFVRRVPYRFEGTADAARYFALHGCRGPDHGHTCTQDKKDNDDGERKRLHAEGPIKILSLWFAAVKAVAAKIQ